MAVCNSSSKVISLSLISSQRSVRSAASASLHPSWQVKETRDETTGEESKGGSTIEAVTVQIYGSDIKNEVYLSITTSNLPHKKEDLRFFSAVFLGWAPLLY